MLLHSANLTIVHLAKKIQIHKINGMASPIKNKKKLVVNERRFLSMYFLSDWEGKPILIHQQHIY